MKKTLLVLFSVLVSIVSGSKLSAQNTVPLPSGETVIGNHLHVGNSNEVWTSYNSLYFNYRGNATSTYFWNQKSNTPEGKAIMSLINNGNVGIGTTTPYAKLDVAVPHAFNQDEEMRIGSYYKGNFYGIGFNYILNGVGDPFSHIVTYYANIRYTPMTFNKDKIGVGTNTITEKMVLYKNDASQVVTQYGNSNTQIGYGKGFLVGIETVGNGIIWNRGNNFIRFGTNAIERMRILSNGNVGIGTTNPKYLLSVKGKIGAGEIVVEDVTSWSDFVFNSDYHLMPLAEVESFIQENNHLPDVPSETEVKEKGINVAEMNAKLLQKIEELTLYVIELKKEVEILKQKQ